LLLKFEFQIEDVTEATTAVSPSTTQTEPMEILSQEFEEIFPAFLASLEKNAVHENEASQPVVEESSHHPMVMQRGMRCFFFKDFSEFELISRILADERITIGVLVGVVVTLSIVILALTASKLRYEHFLKILKKL
jgi:hypothetical protein